MFITATTKASDKKEAAAVKRNEIKELSKIIVAEKSEAEMALAEVLLALEEARLALSKLDKNDITEIRFIFTANVVHFFSLRQYD
jgi:dynein heavy chain